MKISKNGETKTIKYRELLFPRYWFFPQTVKNEIASFLPPGKLLRWGSRDKDVKLLQTMLNAVPELARAKRIKEDGIYGKNTYSKVIDFQRISELGQDGIVGAKTKSKLI